MFEPRSYIYIRHDNSLPGVMKELPVLLPRPLLPHPLVLCPPAERLEGVRKIGVVKLLPRGVEEGSNIGRTEGARGAAVLLGAGPGGAETTPPGTDIEVVLEAPPTPEVEKGVSKHRVKSGERERERE